MIPVAIRKTANPQLYEFFEEVILSGQVPAPELAKWMADDPQFENWLKSRAQFRQGPSRGNTYEPRH